MSAQGTYYIGRVLKLGLLDQEKLIEAIKKPDQITYRGNAWTFIDIEEYNQNGHKYIFGKLSKFAPNGEVTIVDTVSRSEKTQIEPNLKMASSSFIYIPEHSGIAFLNVSNHIEQATFIKKFCEIIEFTHKNYFVDCSIKLVSDLKSFSEKLLSLDLIYQINAKISPPNPLFSPLWAPLEQYLRERNTDKMTIIEDAPESEKLITNLPTLVKQASEQTEDAQFIPEENIPIGDAAILMAADGYGNGNIRGKKNNELVVLKTSESALNFSFSKDPDSYELYLKALQIFERIKTNRHMEHGE